MKTCVNCGMDLRDDEYFCRGCGTYQPDERNLDAIEEENKDYKSSVEIVSETNFFDSSLYYQELYKEEEKVVDLEKDEAIDYINGTTKRTLDTYRPLACNDELVNKPKRNRRTKRTMGTVGKVIIAIGLVCLVFFMKDKFLTSHEKISEGFLDAVCEFKSDKAMEYCFIDDKISEEAKKAKKEIESLEKISLQYDISYRIQNTKEFTSLEKKEFWKNLSDETMFITEDNDDMKEFVLNKVNITRKDLSTGNIENIVFDLYVGKVKGKWKIVGLDKEE